MSCSYINVYLIDLCFDLHSKMKLQNVLNELQSAIKATILKRKIIISFSGGVDSSLLAKLCNDLNYDVTLLTIGFKNCHDILFSKKISNMLDLPHKIYEIHPDEFNIIKSLINQKLDIDNLSWLENAIAFHYMSKASQQLGFDRIVTANGIDELFCGYDIYRRIMPCNQDKILRIMNIKLKNEISMLTQISSVLTKPNIKLIHPFLFCNFIEFAKKIPLFYKIRDQNDLLRKHIIRKIAFQIGIPKISAYKRKKSMQYGSEIHKFI